MLANVLAGFAFMFAPIQPQPAAFCEAGIQQYTMDTRAFPLEETLFEISSELHNRKVNFEAPKLQQSSVNIPHKAVSTAETAAALNTSISPCIETLGLLHTFVGVNIYRQTHTLQYLTRNLPNAEPVGEEVTSALSTYAIYGWVTSNNLTGLI